MQFNILNHTGFMLYYTAAICKIKDFSPEKLLEIVGLVSQQAFLIIWDNFNIAFYVGNSVRHQRTIFITEQWWPSYHSMTLSSVVSLLI